MRRFRVYRVLANVTLNDKKLFETAQIKDLDKSPCKQSTTVVVDFDKSKIEIVRHIGYHLICSCDALVIDEEKNKIDFIELKSLMNILKYGNYTSLASLRRKWKI